MFCYLLFIVLFCSFCRLGSLYDGGLALNNDFCILYLGFLGLGGHLTY